MSTIENIIKKVHSKELLKQKIEQLYALKLSDYVDDNDIKLIDTKLELLQNQLGQSQVYKLHDMDRVLESVDLDFDKVENTKFEYLFDKFLIKNEITMIAAKPSSGKSLTAVALANYCLSNGSVEMLIYFDADNGLTTIKNRNIHVLKQRFNSRFRYIHESSASKAQMWQIIKKLQNTNLQNVMIVFDSIKNFILGDRDKNKDVSKIMETLKCLRRQGGTILFLHHTNKPQRDLSELTYAGSSAWEEDTANAFILTKNEYKNTFIFTPIKNRTGELRELAFKYDESNHSISIVDLLSAKETKIDEEIRIIIATFINNSVQKPCFSQIMKNCEEQGYSKDKINAVIQTGKGIYWIAERKSQNNKDEFELIDSDNLDRSDKSITSMLYKPFQCNALQDKHCIEVNINEY